MGIGFGNGSGACVHGEREGNELRSDSPMGWQEGTQGYRSGVGVYGHDGGARMNDTCAFCKRAGAPKTHGHHVVPACKNFIWLTINAYRGRIDHEGE